MSKNTKKNRELFRIFILTFIVIIAFVVSVGMNIVGMKQVINNKSNLSEKANFSLRQDGVNSLGNEKEKKVDNNGKIAEEDIFIKCIPIIKLNNVRWDRVKAQFTEFELDGDGNAVFSDGYTLYCNGKYVINAVFNDTYTEELVDSIKIGDSFEKIEKTLGVPTFKSKDYLGYKTKDTYVFFYENEVSFYPNIDFNNNDLEQLFLNYFEKTYGKERTYFLVDIRNNYEDFLIDLDEKTNIVTIKSIARQVIAKLDSIGNIEIEFYDGYNVSNETTQKYISKKIFETNEEDLIEIYENERISKK